MRGKRLIVANRKAAQAFRKYHQRADCSDVPGLPPVGVYRKTKVFCSNPYCCGNPRRLRGRRNVSRQELLADLANGDEW
jgi:hypothetical protein